MNGFVQAHGLFILLVAFLLLTLRLLMLRMRGGR